MTVGYFYWVAAPTTLAICCNFLTGIVDVTASTTLSEPQNHKSKHRPRLRVVQKKICLENSALYASNCYCCFFCFVALNGNSSQQHEFVGDTLLPWCSTAPESCYMLYSMCSRHTHICTRCLTCETCWCVLAWLGAMHERKIRIGPWYEHMLPGR